MAGRKRRAGSAAAGVTGGTGGCGGAAPWPEEVGEREQGLYSLHRMFDIVGAQLTHRDVRVLSFLFVDVLDEAERGRIRSGRDFLLALERQGRCDESNLRQLLQLLRIITRHDLLPYVSLKRRRPVCPDLVDKYLEETSIRYVTPRAPGGAAPGLGHPHKSVPAPHPSLCCSLGWVWGPRVGLGSQGGFGVPRVGLGSLGWVWGLWDGFGVPRVGLGSQDGFGVPDPAVSPVPAPHPSLCCSLGWVWGPRVGLGSQGGFGVPRVGLGSLGWVWGLWDGFGVPDPALSPVPAPHPSLCCSLGWVWGPRVGLGSQGGFGVPRVGLGSLGWVWGLWDGFGVPDPAVSPVPAPHPSLCCPPGGPQLGPKRPGRARSLLGNQRKRRKSATPDPKEKQTCDIRLRVRAEYCQHDSALHGNVFSNKQDPLERQFERFNQANTILKSRDLGSIICDIKFSELTYLDAFWRDYINGSLLEALKGVFITDSLKQAVGHEAIKLLVNVDEEDYELGRQKLLRNLMLHTAP
uniref:Death effector domain-containing protein n=1 Tax=Corvus moneduloides TaxID=1196302 RepID=A0A8U7NWA1_CORMO